MPPFSLSWDAPAECPGGDQVRGQIERLLPTAATAQPPLEVQAVVTAIDGGGWRLRMQTRRGDQQGERELTSESCAALAESAAVIVGLMLNPMTLLPAAPAPIEPPAAASVPSAATTLAAPRFSRFVLGVEGSLERGPLPRADGAVGILVGMRGSAWRVDWVTRFRWPEREMAGTAGTAGGDFWLLSAALRGCWVIGAGRVRGGPCGQVDAGALRGRSFGVRAPNRAWAPWLAVGAGPQISLSLTARWALRATGQASLALLRPRFEIDGVGLVHQPKVVALEAGLGAEVYF
jgi:hypothetical protein